MSKVAFAILVLLCQYWSSCGTQYRVIEKETRALVFDFTRYTNQGFMFTPEKYAMEYESIGVVNLVIYSKMEQAQKTIGENPVLNLGWRFVQVNPSELIELAYREAKKMGANAMTNVEITEASKFNAEFKIDVPGVRLRGFAIRRKGN